MKDDVSRRENALDRVPPLGPTFTSSHNANNASGVASQSDDDLRRKEREAARMAQVLKGLAAQREQRHNQDMQKESAAREVRKADFLAKRGRPAPALTPDRGFAYKAEVEARAYQDDLRVERKQAQKRAQGMAKAVMQQETRAATDAKQARKAAFMAQRKGNAVPVQAQEPQQVQGAAVSKIAGDFSHVRTESLSGKMTRAAHSATTSPSTVQPSAQSPARSTPQPATPPAPRRTTSFARTLDR